MKVDVYNLEGKKTSKADLSDDVFGIEPNDHAIYLDVKRYLAAQRQGTHKAKERAEVQGSTKKIKKQKGTGGARAGSLKNPLFVGGGTVFGPRPRKYDIKLNKKVTKLARKSALAYKAKEDGGIRVVKGLAMETPKTKELLGTFGKLGLSDQKTLVVVPEQSQGLYLSSRNLPKHRVMTAGDLSTYDIMNCQNIVFVDNAHEVITGILTA
ncbi:MAG: 50S ribosomal protein L4 [Flavobacteriales bacterium]|nr:50S ribosomal protein L4 [Flavobacteriales bacterium]